MRSCLAVLVGSLALSASFCFGASFTPNTSVSSEGLRRTLISMSFVKKAAEAAVASRHLKKSTIAMGNLIFCAQCDIRTGASYLQEYLGEKVKDPKARRRLQLGNPSDLKAEIEVLWKDVQTFVEHPHAWKVVASFGEKSHSVSSMREIEGALTPMIRVYQQIFFPSDQMAPKIVRRACDSLEKRFLEMQKEGESPLSQEKNFLAGMYLAVAVFYNNNTKMALLYDNRAIIPEIGKRIAAKYGSGPILEFALHVAPHIDVVHRSETAKMFEKMTVFVKRYQWPIGAASALALYGYCSTTEGGCPNLTLAVALKRAAELAAVL